MISPMRHGKSYAMSRMPPSLYFHSRETSLTDFYGDRIYIIYDRERVDAKEILFLSVTEEEIINGSELPSPTIISKPVNTL